MSYSIIPTHRFEKELKRLAKKFPSLKNEFAELIADITANPEAGTFIGNNCYKIRLAIGSKGKGKSGGARVIYVNISDETIWLLVAYTKGKFDNLPTSFLRELKKGIEDAI